MSLKANIPSARDGNRLGPSRRQFLSAMASSPLAAALAGCGGGGAQADASAGERELPAAARSWRMGFGGLPPRLNVASVLENFSYWSRRADMAAIQDEVPWRELLAGADPHALVERDHLELARLYRASGMSLLFVADLGDGLNRALDAPALRELGRSLVEPEVQLAWRRYVVAAARLLQPEWICLGVETNLTRIAAPAEFYAAVRDAANAAAVDLRAAGLTKRPQLVSSVQIETAWGLMPGQDGRFVGISEDRRDFAFAECLGLSSYPYLAKTRPEEMPDDWYRRVIGGAGLPVMVVEGGWISDTVPGPQAAPLASTPELQRRYIERQAQLLDGISAVGWVQLYFADLDLSAVQGPLPANLKLFSHLGLVDRLFQPKPALAAWDSLHARRRI